MKFANSSAENTYKTVYADQLGESGRCTSCGEECEDTEHAVWGCPRAEVRWDELDKELEARWREEGLEWKRWNWVTYPREWGDWNRGWGLAGLVPGEAIDRVVEECNLGYIGAYTLLRDTATRILETSEAAWTARVKAALEWEKENEELAERKAEMKRTEWNQRSGKQRKQREKSTKRSREEEEQREKDEARDAAKARERERILEANIARYKAGCNPIRRGRAQEMVDEAGRRALDIGKRRARMKRKEDKRAVGSARLQVIPMTTNEFQRAPPRRLRVPRYPGQRGLWFPTMGTRTTTFWIDEKGDEVVGGLVGTTEEGVVSGTKWEEGENPKFSIKYGNGAEVWHCTVEEAGAAITPTNDKLGTMRKHPGEVLTLLGHGTAMEVAWTGKTTKREEWYQGRIVARDHNEGIAIRYGTKSTASVAWHTYEDLEDRGYAIMELRRLGEHTNESYQGLTVNMAMGCLLLTNEDACACEWCRGKGWPQQVKEAEEQGMDITELGNMEPEEGRQELARRKEEERRKRAANATRETRIRRKTQRQSGESFAAGTEKLRKQNGDRKGSSRKRDRGTDQEGGGGEEEEQGHTGRSEEARAEGDKEQGSGGGHRPRTRSQGVGLAGRSARQERDTAEAEYGMDERMDRAWGAQGEQSQGRRSLGDDGAGTEEERGAGGQRGIDRGSKELDATARGAGKRKHTDTQDGKEGSDEIEQDEPVQADGRSRRFPRNAGTDDCDRGTGCRNRQGRGGSQRYQGRVGNGIVGMGEGQVLAAGNGGERGVDTGSREQSEEREDGAEAERGARGQEDNGHRRRVGVDRDCSGADGGRVFDDRPRQGRISGPGGAVRRDNQQAEDGSVFEGNNERTEEGSKDGREIPGIIRDGLAVTRVQDPDCCERYECVDRGCQREADTRREEQGCDVGGGTGREGGGAEAVRPGGGESDGSSGAGDREDQLRTGESCDKRLVGAPSSEVEDGQGGTELASDHSGSVCVREEVQEADQDTDKYDRVESQRHHWKRKVCDREVRRDEREPSRPRPRQTRTADDHHRRSEKATGGGDDGPKQQERVQRESRKESGTGTAGARDCESGHREAAGGSEPEEEEEGSRMRRGKRKPLSEKGRERNTKRQRGQNQERDCARGEDKDLDKDRKHRGHDEDRTDSVLEIRKGIG